MVICWPSPLRELPRFGRPLARPAVPSTRGIPGRTGTGGRKPGAISGMRRDIVRRTACSFLSDTIFLWPSGLLTTLRRRWVARWYLAVCSALKPALRRCVRSKRRRSLQPPPTCWAWRTRRGRWGLISARICLSVSYTHLRAHETDSYLVCRLLLEKKKKDYQHSILVSEV